MDAIQMKNMLKKGEAADYIKNQVESFFNIPSEHEKRKLYKMSRFNNISTTNHRLASPEIQEEKS